MALELDAASLRARLVSARHLHRHLARDYVDHAQHGLVLNEIETRLLQHIMGVKVSPRRALTHGCDSKNYVQALHQEYPNSAWTVSAPIAAPLRLHRSRWWRRRPSVQHASHLLPYRDASFGMMISNLVGSNPATLPMFLEEASRLIEADGLVAVSLLGPNSLREFREAWASIDNGAHVAQCLDMHDVGDILVQNGFSGVVMDAEELIITYPDVASAAREMRQLGIANVDPIRTLGMTTPRRWKQVCASYPQQNQRIPVTLELVYAHAWRTQSKNSAQVQLIWP